MLLTRAAFIEQCIRQIYGEQPSDDASITKGLVNQYIEQAIAVAAKSCYIESVKLDGVSYVNNSFYTTFKGIAPTKDEFQLWKVALPQIPVGIGRNEGISTLEFRDANGNVSFPCVPLSQAQRSLYKTTRTIPNKILFYPEGVNLMVISGLNLAAYTTSVTMVSGGDGTDLNSVLNVPQDYIQPMIQFIRTELGFERAQPKDNNNDGAEN